MIRRILLSSTAFLLCAAPVTAADAGLPTLSLGHVEAVKAEEDRSADTVLSRELDRRPVAEGKMPLENPTELITHYGYAGDGPLAPAEGDVQS